MPFDLGSCPFGADAGGGILVSTATRTELGTCAEERSLCSVRVEVPCQPGGRVITQWACDCASGKWRCEVSAKNPAFCPDGAT